MGSEEANTTSCGYLERKTYEELSERTQATFASQRHIIYNIFEIYHAQKRQRNGFDAADRYMPQNLTWKIIKRPYRTHAILQVFAKNGLKGHKIDQL